MCYRNETVQVSGEFQNRQCKLFKCKGVITFKRGKKYAMIKYQNKTIQQQCDSNVTAASK